MSISSEIARISGNVSDALDEIAAKGVTVPSGANSDDLPALIRSIPSGGGLTVDLLWTNDSPTSNFAAQAVALSADISDYKLIYFDYRFSTSTPDRSAAIYLASLLSGDGTFTLKINAGSYNRTGVRTFSLRNDGTVVFDGANYNAASNNGYIIPLHIYGIA